MSEKKQYNYGLALLKIFSMMGIVILHTLNNGGVYLFARVPSVLKVSCQFLILPLACCAVNCFAITTGYLAFHSADRPFSIKRWLGLWLEVVFYGVGLDIAAHFIIGTKLDILTNLMPVSNSCYWYFTAYTALTILTPLLRKIAVAVSEQTAKKMLVVMVVLLPLYTFFVPTNGQDAENFTVPTKGQDADIFTFVEGYNAIWLIYLYICGILIAKTGAFDKVKSMWIVLAAVLGVVLSGTNADFYYTYMPVILTSFALFLLFKRLPIKGGKGIKLLSDHSFAVYLVNTQRDWFKWYYNKFKFIVDRSPLFSVSFILGYAVVFFMAAALFDILRGLLFRVLRIDTLCAKVSDLAKKAVTKAASFI